MGEEDTLGSAHRTGCVHDTREICGFRRDSGDGVRLPELEERVIRQHSEMAMCGFKFREIFFGGFAVVNHVFHLLGGTKRFDQGRNQTGIQENCFYFSFGKRFRQTLLAEGRVGGHNGQ